MKKFLISIFMCFFLMLNLSAQSATSHPEVVFDGFNVTEPNHAKVTVSLKTLTNSNISITGTDASKIKFGEYDNGYGKNDDGTIKPYVGVALYYEGPVTFGTGTDTAKNTVDAEVKLRWPNGATLYDGTKADVLMTISEIEFNVEKLKTNMVQQSKYILAIAVSYNNKEFWFTSQAAQTRVLTDGPITEELAAEVDTEIQSGNSYKVKMQLLKSGTNTPIDETKYTNFAFGMNDIDMTDRTVDVSEYTDEQVAEKYIKRADGLYTEGVEFIEGFDNTVHFAYNTDNKPEDFLSTEQSVIRTVTGTHNGVKVVVDAHKITNKDIRPGPRDNTTYYSGFVTMASPQSSTFYWTGNDCSSKLFSPQDVLIREKHNADGLVTTTSYGEGIIFEKLDQWEETYHPGGSSPVYTYNPKTGYYLVSLKIDDEETEAASNFKYTFNTLFYNPLVRLDADANVIKDENDNPVYVNEPHSIEIVYAPNAFIVVYEDGGGTDGVEKMPDQDGVYGEPIALQENEYAKTDYDFVNWKVFIEDSEGNRTNYLDSKGKQIYFNDQDVVNDIPVPNNGKLVLVAMWRPSSPKTGILSVSGILLLLVAGFIVYKSTRKNKINEI